jgi:hypothetical protein
MRGQLSLEAILVIGMAVIVLTSFFNPGMARYFTAKDLGEAGEARMAGELLATAINTGFSNGEGFSLFISNETLNFTKLKAAGVVMPLVIDSGSRSITIRKNMPSGGGEVWNVSVKIIPSNLVFADSTSLYPALTIRNNGTHVIIYGNSSNILVQ